MIDLDFEYDGKCLSDFGFMICSFDNNTEETLDGSKMTFNQTSIMMGRQHLLASAKYEECITTEFDICKINCTGQNEDFYVSAEEEIELRRWLNRKKFYKFHPLSDRYAGIYFNGSFNLQTKVISDNVVGMHLIFTSDSPFGYTDTLYKFDAAANESHVIYDMSDETGDTYLNADILCESSGDLEIINLFNNRKTIIKNCSEGETISFKNLIISSSIEERNSTIMNDFNFIFPMISNDYSSRKNAYFFSLPCSVVFQYKELRKIGV